jgi:hypothetical protein
VPGRVFAFLKATLQIGFPKVYSFLKFRPMKLFNQVYDIFLYQGVFTFLLGASLFLMEDPFSDTLIFLSVISLGTALVLGCMGAFFRLFSQKQEE